AAVGGVRTDVENHLVGTYLRDFAHVGVCGGGELAADHHIARQRNLRAARLRLVEPPPRHVQHVLLVQRAADGHAGGGEEGVGDATADDQLIDLLQQRLQHQ